MLPLLCHNALRVARFMLAIFGLFTASQAIAVCTAGNPYTVQIPLQAATFSAGENFPVGSNIRVQLVRGYTTVTTNCTKSGAYVRLSLDGGMLYPGQSNIYQTGVAGLGVRFMNPYEKRYYPLNTSYLGGLVNPNGWLDFTIELVKMGPITAGTVNTALFPQVRIDAMDADNSPARVAWHSINGSFTLQTPTCTTPDYSWELGTTDTKTLKNQGDASTWVDTPVTLIGCSAFLGNNSNGSYTQYNISGFSSGTVSQSGSISPNQLTMKLTPRTPILDASKGIIANDSATPASASGVGVQLGIRQSGSYTPQNLDNSLVITPAVGERSGTVTFPLGARLIRTSDSVQGGKVNASVTYTINYQ